MAGLKGRLGKLQQEAEGLYATISLQDGTQVRYAPEEMLHALSAAIHSGEHRLLPFVRRIDTREGLPGLINALDASRVHAEGGEES
jgi:hypothetical protein